MKHASFSKLKGTRILSSRNTSAGESSTLNYKRNAETVMLGECGYLIRTHNLLIQFLDTICSHQSLKIYPLLTVLHAKYPWALKAFVCQVHGRIWKRRSVSTSNFQAFTVNNTFCVSKHHPYPRQYLPSHFA